MLTNNEIQEIIAQVDSGEYDIDDALNDIAVAAKGEDVRRALYAEAYTLNKEGHTGSADLKARGSIATLQTEIGFLETGKADKTDVDAVDARMDTLIGQIGSENRETVLFSGNVVGTGAVIALSDSITNYDYIDVYVDKQGATEIRTIPATTSTPYCLRFLNVPDDTSSKRITMCEFWLQSVSANSYTIIKEMNWEWNGVSGSDAEITAIPEGSTYYSAAKITRIVGRKNNSQFINAELEDIRVAADGTTHNTAGASVRAQVSDIYDEIGDLELLITEDKSDLVSAINEAAQSTGGGEGTGVTDAVKEALLMIAQKVAYIDQGGASYYQALYDALYPPASLTSIAAVYTQSGTVYETTPLDSLKDDLVVTAIWDDGTRTTVTSDQYTLSGTLTEGSSTITVTHGGKTTTFSVTVSVYSTAPIITTEGVCWSKYAPNTVNKAGFGVTQWYEYEFTQEALEACQYWDSTNQYMTVNGWAGIKVYVPDTNTYNAGYSWPASSNFKHVLGKNDVYTEYYSITRNAVHNIMFSRQSRNAVESDCVSFSIPLLDKDDAYAYWYKPAAGSIFPTGVAAGDIIFAGANTPYYGLHNISEAET